MSRAPSARALDCIRAAVASQPPPSEASTCTASLPELRKTPRHRSATRYVWPSTTPTRLLPSPTSASSLASTVCRVPPGRDGSTVRANSVFSVLAGGSGRCASDAASTSPLPASATSHDSAETYGTPGAPGCGRTWVPERYRSDGCGTAALGRPGGAGSATAGISASTPAAHRAQVEAATREESPIII